MNIYTFLTEKPLLIFILFLLSFIIYLLGKTDAHEQRPILGSDSGANNSFLRTFKVGLICLGIVIVIFFMLRDNELLSLDGEIKQPPINKKFGKIITHHENNAEPSIVPRNTNNTISYFYNIGTYSNKEYALHDSANIYPYSSVIYTPNEKYKYKIVFGPYKEKIEASQFKEAGGEDYLKGGYVIGFYSTDFLLL